MLSRLLTKHGRPLLGGSLANPAERYPTVFSASLWKVHPYLLPLLIGATFRMLAIFLVFFYLKEVTGLSYLPLLEAFR